MVRYLVAVAFHAAMGPMLAQAAPDTNPLPLLINYGVLGIATILWLTGRIETPKRGDAAEARAAAAEARERALEDTLRGEVVPALVRFTETAQRILDRAGPAGPTA